MRRIGTGAIDWQTVEKLCAHAGTSFDLYIWTTETHRAGCSKSPSSKAAGESKPEACPQGYVEDFDEPRTTLAGFFSILQLAIWNLPVNRSQPGTGKVSVDLRETPASIKLSD